MIDFEHALRMVSSYDAFVDSDRIYLMSEITNVFFDISLKDGKSTCCCLPGEYYIEDLIICLVEFGSNILLVPFNASSIFMYDIYKKEMKEVLGILNPREGQISGKFITAIAYEQQVILIGENIHAIIFLEGVHTGDKINVKKVKYDKKYKFTSSYSIHNNILYLPIRDDMKILSISLINYDISIISLDHFYDDLEDVTINLFRNKIVFLNKYDCQVSVELDKVYEKEKVSLINKESILYRKIFCIDNFWIYFDLYDGRIGIRHERDKEIERVPFNIDTALLKYRRDKESVFTFVKEFGGKIFFQNRLSGKCYYLDINAVSISEVPINISKDQHKIIINKWKESLMDYYKFFQLIESDFFNLCDFLKCV